MLPETSKYAIYTQKELLKILLCILQRYFAFYNPNPALKNKINNLTNWRIFTLYPWVRFMSSYVKSRFEFIFVLNTD